ncbi:MAG: serine/threonine protein kinase [Deltaproteobacteria bacterium]|nr:serine/threonine protein kinase [Deltaproteobacteria bacterium]
MDKDSPRAGSRAEELGEIGADTVDDAPRIGVPRITPLPTATARFMLSLAAGSPVGEYVIQDQIGEGAMGTVYSAIQPLIGKTVAIKVLKPELCTNQASIDRFVTEAQAVNRIGHPNIVDVFSLGELPDGRAYMVMEWLRGEDLKMRLGRGPLSIADACDLLAGIARALEAAHAKDIVHRDLKPDNVFLHRVDGGPVMVKLLDFGIAKLMRAHKIEKTATGNMLGTPRYISPEQARGIDVTHCADIYSLGVMAYEMLAGRPPFQGETAMDLVVKHLSEDPPALSQFARVPRALEQCVMQMIEKDPAKRPTLAEVRQVLVDPSRRLARPSRRAPILAAAVVLVGAGGFAAWRLARGGDEVATTVATPFPAPAAPPPPVVETGPTPPEVTMPAVAATGMLEIAIGNAKSASVYVDGALWEGKREIAAGEHEVEVRANGNTIKKRVTVAAGKDQVVMMDAPAATTKRPPVRQPPATVKKPPGASQTPPPPPPPPRIDDELILAPKKDRK